MKKQTDISIQVSIIGKRIENMFQPIVELVRGVKNNTVPWALCTTWMLIFTVVFVLGFDQFIISKIGLIDLYPYFPPFYKLYVVTVSTLAFWLWSIREVQKRREKLKTLTQAFKNAGLESKIGRLPNLISDFPIDSMTRKMRLTNAGFPITSFRSQSSYIESELGIYIDDLKESREKRAIDIIYSHYPMPSSVQYSYEKAKASTEYYVGQTRSHSVTSQFKKSPHLLIAGQTGGGKSTFLRQLIVHLHLKQPKDRFLLIDLKGGLEFSLFDNRKAFTVVPDVHKAVSELTRISKLLDERMKFLKSETCKDIDDYIAKDGAKKTWMERQYVVVDEAAEMFLAGPHAKANEIQAARAALSRIARLGRAVGVHLIIATQLPSSKSLDPQVKSNLTSAISFQMMTDSASIAVLGNGRATDLPKIPGRAIWKHGIDMTEVQTPLLTPDEATKLLGPPDDPKNNESVQDSTQELTEQNESQFSRADLENSKED